MCCLGCGQRSPSVRAHSRSSHPWAHLGSSGSTCAFVLSKTSAAATRHPLLQWAAASCSCTCSKSSRVDGGKGRVAVVHADWALLAARDTRSASKMRQAGSSSCMAATGCAAAKLTLGRTSRWASCGSTAAAAATSSPCTEQWAVREASRRSAGEEARGDSSVCIAAAAAAAGAAAPLPSHLPPAHMTHPPSCPCLTCCACGCGRSAAPAAWCWLHPGPLLANPRCSAAHSA